MNKILMLFALFVMAGVVIGGAQEAEAAPTLVKPANNENVTADIYYNVTINGASWENMTIWRSSDNVTFTTFATNSTAQYLANTSGTWKDLLGVANLSDGAYYWKVSGNGTANSTADTYAALDDTSPTVSCSWLKRLQEGRLQTVTCTITDTGFTTALTGNATVVTGDRFAGTKTMTGSAGSYKYEWSARSLGLRDITVTAYDDHSWSTSSKFTYNVLEGSVSPEIGQQTIEGVAIKTTQVQKKAILIVALGAAGFFLLLLAYLGLRLSMGKKKGKR